MIRNVITIAPVDRHPAQKRLQTTAAYLTCLRDQGVPAANLKALVMALRGDDIAVLSDGETEFLMITIGLEGA
jgi:hypothetical protein